MGFRSVPKLTVAEELRGFARVVVRAGTYDDERTYAEIVEAVRASGSAEPEIRATALLEEATSALSRDQASWPDVTDFDRLQTMFADLDCRGLPVLQAIEDHWVAQAELERRARTGQACRGVVWFTAPDVWHAVDHGMLELNVWHADSANVADGDPLLAEVLEALATAGFDAQFDEGRIEVSAYWHRRPGT